MHLQKSFKRKENGFTTQSPVYSRVSDFNEIFILSLFSSFILM
jgi:hypothetical protein